MLANDFFDETQSPHIWAVQSLQPGVSIGKPNPASSRVVEKTRDACLSIRGCFLSPGRLPTRIRPYANVVLGDPSVGPGWEAR
jgi:hypothetical protein